MNAIRTMQYKSTPTATAWQIAQAVASWMAEHGFEATARKGGRFASPDDEQTVNCCTVTASSEAWDAFKRRSK